MYINNCRILTDKPQNNQNRKSEFVSELPAVIPKGMNDFVPVQCEPSLDFLVRPFSSQQAIGSCFQSLLVFVVSYDRVRVSSQLQGQDWTKIKI